MLKILKEWISSILGKKLKSVYGLIYIYETEDINHPQELKFIFETGLIKKISCASDGSTLLIQDTPIIESDLAEYGKQLIKDISDIPAFNDLIDEELHDIEIINSEIEQSIVGLKFQFSNSKVINILTLGDEISFYKNIPVNLIEDERLSFLSIKE